jgi:hypothetical protein
METTGIWYTYYLEFPSMDVWYAYYLEFPSMDVWYAYYLEFPSSALLARILIALEFR